MTNRNKEFKIPEATVQRLSVYLRCLECMERDGKKIVSSYELADSCSFKAAQIRKDFAYFGELGVRGVGYYIKDLIKDLKKILGLEEIWDVALVGAGHLGSALMAYKGFIEYGFRIKAVFDSHPEKVEAEFTTDHDIYDISKLSDVISKEKIRIGIIAVPAAAAQQVADQLMKAGVTAVLNFAPIKLRGAEGVKIRNVDLAVDLGVLTFFLTNRRRG